MQGDSQLLINHFFSLIEKEVVSLIEKVVIDETCANLTLVTLLNKDKTSKKS